MALDSQLLAQDGALTSWLSATDNLQHVEYIGQNGHVHDFTRRWATDLGATTISP